MNDLLQQANVESYSTLGITNYSAGTNDTTDLLATANDDSDLDDFSLF